MPAVTRLMDMCTGHQCWAPRINIQGSENVFVNFLPVHRQTDAWVVHCCIDCHAGVLAQGSPNVYANFLQVGRIGDPVSCGSSVAQGSPNVFAND
jgi:uncharacterized Zn-binding protein involved in type VI secretion